MLRIYFRAFGGRSAALGLGVGLGKARMVQPIDQPRLAGPAFLVLDGLPHVFVPRNPSDVGSRVIGGCRPFAIAVHPTMRAIVWSIAGLRAEEVLGRSKGNAIASHRAAVALFTALPLAFRFLATASPPPESWFGN